eukprot:CAMPEP_0168336918 /NCGR_PEP_ID=MMETSP0213-20121227/11844_1 /TAXON_ID=151035 /ORGANISM="Euplotes harpa, Strain FSP1.4" /LENGTH=228 /DNA_ID=CAMNT_0008342235 /DNA_START=804 /DNA_END=1491 /DNA_ORIENTATION=+
MKSSGAMCGPPNEQTTNEGAEVLRRQVPVDARGQHDAVGGLEEGHAVFGRAVDVDLDEDVAAAAHAADDLLVPGEALGQMNVRARHLAEALLEDRLEHFGVRAVHDRRVLVRECYFYQQFLLLEAFNRMSLGSSDEPVLKSDHVRLWVHFDLKALFLVVRDSVKDVAEFDFELFDLLRRHEVGYSYESVISHLDPVFFGSVAQEVRHRFGKPDVVGLSFAFTFWLLLV